MIFAKGQEKKIIHLCAKTGGLFCRGDRNPGKGQHIAGGSAAVDSLIAATALTHHLTVVTRNTADMEASDVALLNPW